MAKSASPCRVRQQPPEVRCWNSYPQLVHDVVEAFLTAIGLYVGTNVDNLVILIVTFIAARKSNVGRWKIVVGQHLGFIAILLISTLATLGLSEVSTEVIGLPGIVPLSIGIDWFCATS